MKHLEAFTKARNVAMVFGLSLALAGMANAAEMRSAAEHKLNVRHLEINSPTEVGGVLLPAGDYEVHEINSANGPELRFVREYWNELASELMQATEEQVIANVKFTEQPLETRAKHTALVADGEKNTVGLEVRGKNVEYVLGQATAGPDASYANAGEKTKAGQ